jgi:hemolysin III
MNRISDTSAGEEILNTVTQGIGVIMSVIGLIYLINISAIQGNQNRLPGYIVYGSSLILMFLSSGLFHAFYYSKISKQLQILDYAVIFVLIAGSFTPLNQVLLHGNFRIITLVLVWLVALAGIIVSALYSHKTNLLLIVFLSFGWLGLIFINPLLQRSNSTDLILFLSGGLFFTAGTIFYKWNKLIYHHGIWHLFILAGCTLHFLTIISL